MEEGEQEKLLIASLIEIEKPVLGPGEEETVIALQVTVKEELSINRLKITLSPRGYSFSNAEGEICEGKEYTDEDENVVNEGCSDKDLEPHSVFSSVKILIEGNDAVTQVLSETSFQKEKLSEGGVYYRLLLDDIDLEFLENESKRMDVVLKTKGSLLSSQTNHDWDIGFLENSIRAKDTDNEEIYEGYANRLSESSLASLFNVSPVGDGISIVGIITKAPKPKVVISHNVISAETRFAREDYKFIDFVLAVNVTATLEDLQSSATSVFIPAVCHFDKTGTPGFYVEISQDHIRSLSEVCNIETGASSVGGGAYYEITIPANTQSATNQFTLNIRVYKDYNVFAAGTFANPSTEKASLKVQLKTINSIVRDFSGGFNEYDASTPEVLALFTEVDGFYISLPRTTTLEQLNDGVSDGSFNIDKLDILVSAKGKDVYISDTCGSAGTEGVHIIIRTDIKSSDYSVGCSITFYGFADQGNDPTITSSGGFVHIPKNTAAYFRVLLTISPLASVTDKDWGFAYRFEKLTWRETTMDSNNTILFDDNPTPRLGSIKQYTPKLESVDQASGFINTISQLADKPIEATLRVNLKSSSSNREVGKSDFYIYIPATCGSGSNVGFVVDVAPSSQSAAIIDSCVLDLMGDWFEVAESRASFIGEYGLTTIGGIEYIMVRNKYISGNIDINMTMTGEQTGDISAVLNTVNWTWRPELTNPPMVGFPIPTEDVGGEATSTIRTNQIAITI